MKTIISAYDGTPGAETALDHAMALAARSDAHVAAVFAHAAPETYAEQGSWIPKEARAIIARSNQRLVDEAEAAFAAAAKRFDAAAKLSFESITGRVDDVLARRSRAADLLVTARPQADVDMHVVQHPDLIALRSGRPLLIVPPKAPAPTQPAPVVLAWDGKRAAARALADALPLLLAGSEITLLTIGDDTLMRPAQEVIDHLTRHGFTARHVERPSSGRVADAIIAYCAETQPGLLVLGAYEHSKFQVGLVGGPTVEVLHRAAMPVLMSH